MQIHPTHHHLTLSSFLSSPTIHFIHEVIAKTCSFNPRGSSLLQRPVCVVHLEHVHILVDKCRFNLDPREISLKGWVVIRRQSQLPILVCKSRAVNASFRSTHQHQFFDSPPRFETRLSHTCNGNQMMVNLCLPLKMARQGHLDMGQVCTHLFHQDNLLSDQ